jgi:quercetin dioxygenase-like cupin family protein
MSTMTMSADAFRAALLRDGWEVLDRTYPAGHAVPEHSHPFEARLLVTEGAFTLTCGGTPTTYRAGEQFAVPAGVRHAEATGAEGAQLVVGRRHPA